MIEGKVASSVYFRWRVCASVRRHRKTRSIFLCNKTKWMHKFHKFILSWNATCFWQFVCPSSGVYSLYTQQWYMSYRSVDSFRAEAYAPARKLSTNMYDMSSLLSVQWINSWWWTDELSETCRVSWQNKFVKLVHLVGFITKKFVTMHGHMNVKLGPCEESPGYKDPYAPLRYVVHTFPVFLIVKPGGT
jgi:hypothetical protein